MSRGAAVRGIEHCSTTSFCSNLLLGGKYFFWVVLTETTELFPINIRRSQFTCHQSAVISQMGSNFVSFLLSCIFSVKFCQLYLSRNFFQTFHLSPNSLSLPIRTLCYICRSKISTRSANKVFQRNIPLL